MNKKISNSKKIDSNCDNLNIHFFEKDVNKLKIFPTITENCYGCGNSVITLYAIERNYELAYITLNPNNNIDIIELQNFTLKIQLFLPILEQLLCLNITSINILIFII